MKFIFVKIIMIGLLWACLEERGEIKIEPSQIPDVDGVAQSGWSMLVGVSCNSYNAECNPWVTYDGTKLYFVAADDVMGPPRDTVWGHFGSYDIYVSEWDSLRGEWGPARNLGPNINTELPERRPTLSRTGDTLYFGREGDTGDIYMSVFVGDSWTVAVPLGPPINTPQATETDPAISYDGKYLYFVRRYPGGSSDIWVAYREGATWDSVWKLDYPVNTEANEVAPYITPDGKTLYFSDFKGPRPGGYGNADIWVTTLDANGNWTTPQVLPPPLNNNYNHCSPCLSPNGKMLYTGGNGDIVTGGDEEVWVAYLDSVPQPKVI